MRYKLVRKNSSVVNYGDKALWINKDSAQTIPDVGCSLLLDTIGDTHFYLSSPAIEIIENTDGYVKFKTKESEYKLIINNV